MRLWDEFTDQIEQGRIFGSRSCARIARVKINGDLSSRRQLKPWSCSYRLVSDMENRNYNWNNFGYTSREMVSDYSPSDPLQPFPQRMSSTPPRQTIKKLQTQGGAEWETDVPEIEQDSQRDRVTLKPIRIVIYGCEILFLIGAIIIFAARPIALLGAFLVLVAIQLFVLSKFIDYLERLTLRRTG